MPDLAMSGSRICTMVRGGGGALVGGAAVLSVWKLGHGQEAYYLEAVAQGVEDYYVGGEAPGRWIASSGTALGLAGEVAPDDLHAVLSGRDPSSGTRLGQPHRVPGFDLTFRAPKSVSVLFGLGDPGTARQVRDAHDHAVEAALELGRAPRRVVATRARRRRAGARRGADRGGVPAPHDPQRRPAPPHPRPRAEHGAAVRTASGRRSTPAGCTRRPRRSATSTRRSSATTSPSPSASSGATVTQRHRRHRAHPARRCSRRSRRAAPRSRSGWRSATSTRRRRR